MTTMAVDVHEYGLRVGRAILKILNGDPVTESWAPTARLVLRGTTAHAPGSP